MLCNEYIDHAKIGSFTPITRGKSLLYVPFTNIFYIFSPLAFSLVLLTHFTPKVYLSYCNCCKHWKRTSFLFFVMIWTSRSVILQSNTGLIFLAFPTWRLAHKCPERTTLSASATSLPPRVGLELAKDAVEQ